MLVIPEIDRKDNYHSCSVPRIVRLAADESAIPSGADWQHVRVWQRVDQDSSEPVLRLMASRTFDDDNGAPVATPTRTVRIHVIDVDKGPVAN